LQTDIENSSESPIEKGHFAAANLLPKWSVAGSISLIRRPRAGFLGACNGEAVPGRLSAAAQGVERRIEPGPAEAANDGGELLG